MCGCYTSQNFHALATTVTFLVAARMTMTTSRMTTTDPEAQMTLFNMVSSSLFCDSAVANFSRVTVRPSSVLPVRLAYSNPNAVTSAIAYLRVESCHIVVAGTSRLYSSTVQSVA